MFVCGGSRKVILNKMDGTRFLFIYLLDSFGKPHPNHTHTNLKQCNLIMTMGKFEPSLILDNNDTPASPTVTRQKTTLIIFRTQPRGNDHYLQGGGGED
jgi:hypothetical protein